MSTKKREVIFGGRIIGANIRAQQARERAKGKPFVPPTAPRPRRGRSGWKLMAGRRSRRQPSASALTAGSAGLKLSATAARRA
jgi:hypothetical protein